MDRARVTRATQDILRAVAFIGAATYAVPACSRSAGNCASLASLELKDTRILAAEVIEGPTYSPPRIWSFDAQSFTDLPSFCRVSAVIAPAVHFEVWMPLADWNGKFQGTGNYGYYGSIIYGSLAAGVRRHYATSNTDMGHVATSPDPGSWALKRPDLVVDQGYRAQHETAVRSKELVRAFYGKAPRLSYFTGCSSGGWQGLTEAQRFPHDYDGIVAGAPAISVVHLHAVTLLNYAAGLPIATEKFQLVTDAVLKKCDASDGVKDGLLSDPLACNFDPAELTCKAGSDAASCLTGEEVGAFRKFYAGLSYSSGEPIYPGLPRSSEYMLPSMRVVLALAESTFKDMVFEDPTWDYRRIDFDRDVRYADARIGDILNSNSPDLREFRRAGGKLILYHGWHDAGISPLNTVDYFERVAAFMAEGRQGKDAALFAVQPFARLFLAPGMGHCGGGPGPDNFDALAALEKWVEEGAAPESIVASHLSQGVVDRTRPLCPYPQVALYKGTGSIDEAANFRCEVGRH